MSGHSHWHSIKHQKEAADKKRGKVFSKLSREISVAAREGGGDPNSNPSLRLVIEKAKKLNMPKDNIERAIKKGTGEIEGASLEPFAVEAYGPEKTALIIEGITDNKNRTLSEIKQILNQKNGKMAEEGSVKWMFDRKGCILIEVEEQEEKSKDKEALSLKIIESGAEDMKFNEDLLEVFTSPDKLEEVKNNLEKEGIQIENATIGWVAKDEIELDEKKKGSCESLFEALDENDAVQEIYSNLKN